MCVATNTFGPVDWLGHLMAEREALSGCLGDDIAKILLRVV